MKLKELLTKLEKAETLTESIDMETNENAWDKAYELEYEAFCELVTEIMNLIKCDRPTANAMITKKRTNLKALVANI
jgi:hypothetical protein